MSDVQKEFGLIGLGNIGGNLVAQALAKGWRVVGYARHGASETLLRAGLISIADPSEFRAKLISPRVVFLYVPAGAAVDELLGQLAAALDVGDIVADGGNSYWGDTVRRCERLKGCGIHLIDVGTSGGVAGARDGACFMAGGERSAVARVEPILLALAADGGYVHAGPPGAGHFVKLVHNGIEFGMLQAIAEGLDLLEHYRDALPVADVLRCWRNGSVIRSWLVELLEQEYRERGGLGGVSSYVEDTGEVNWLIDDAMRMEVPIPVIAQSVMQLLASRDSDRNWARAVAMMRHRFGNHPYGPDEDIAKHRTHSRVGGFVDDA